MNPLKAVSFIERASSFMKDRATNIEMELSESFKQQAPWHPGIKIGGRKVTWSTVQGFAYALIRLGDVLGAYPTWLGAYHKALSEFDGDHVKATRFADRVVSRTQPHSGNMFKTLWQMGGKNSSKAGKLLKWSVSPFMGWTSMVGARGGERWNKFQDGTISGREYATYLALEMIAPAVLATLINGVVSGDDLDDPEDYIWSAVGYSVSWIPYVNLVPRGLQHGLGFLEDNPLIKPGALFVKGLKAAGEEAYNVYEGDEHDLWRVAMGWGEFSEYILGFPALRTGKQLYEGTEQLLDGETRNPFALVRKQKKRDD